MRRIDYLVVHHSAGPDDPRAMSWDEIRRFHVTAPPAGRGWADIGYHLGLELVEGEPTGLIGRPWPLPGAHAPGRNADSLGLCIVGNFDLAPPSPVLWRAAVALCSWLLDTFNLPPAHVLGHREATPHRTCPGRHFDLDALRAAL